MNRRTLLAAPALAAFSAPTRSDDCRRSKIAELPLRLIEGYPIVTASLAGQPVSFLLDTGAQGMLVTPDMAAALALPLAGMTRIFGTGGSQEARLVRLPGLRLGDAPMPEQRAPVAALPIGLSITPPLAGLLGASLLSRFDLELDAPAGRAALWSPADCPWPGTAVPLDLSSAGEAFIPVRVNGQTLLALVDTGSRATLLTQGAAHRLGLSAPVSANTAPGVDGERLPLQHVRVRLAVGGQSPADASFSTKADASASTKADASASTKAGTPVSIAPLRLDHGDMLLGMDIVGRRRIVLAYAQRLAVFDAR